MLRSLWEATIFEFSLRRCAPPTGRRIHRWRASKDRTLGPAVDDVVLLALSLGTVVVFLTARGRLSQRAVSLRVAVRVVATSRECNASMAQEVRASGDAPCVSDRKEGPAHHRVEVSRRDDFSRKDQSSRWRL
jgi:predicted alpha/beta hydrolase family esterase